MPRIPPARDSFRDYAHARGSALSRTALLLTGDPHLAQDLVQQTLIGVASRWERIIAGGDPDAYVRWALYHWHLQRLDLATGRIVDESTRARPGDPTLVAWRDGEPVVQQTHLDGSCDTVAISETGERRLPLTVAGRGCAAYARDLLEDGVLGGPGIAPSPWQAQWWANLLVCVLLSWLVVIAWRILRRRRTASHGRARRPRVRGGVVTALVVVSGRW